jgi:transcriptional antiterminator RfaH
MELSFWYVAQTKPRQEGIALVNLERQGFVVNLPRIPRIKPSPRLPDNEVLFPGYIFFAPHSTTQSISPVRSTTGVSRLVKFGQKAATLPVNMLDQILCFIDDRRAAPGGLAAHVNRLKKGSAVQITQGPFARLEGLVSCVAEDRVMVLLQIMGKAQNLAFEPRLVEAMQGGEWGGFGALGSRSHLSE